MERKLWNQLCAVVVRLDNAWTNGFYRASEILVVFLWAVVHDRPTSWACEVRHWDGPPSLGIPHQSTVSRRLRSRSVQELLQKVETELRGKVPDWWIQRIDSKPLPVGAHRKDRNARWGRVRRGYARGDRLHAIWGDGLLPSAWRIESMNASDSTAACRLLANLPGEGYIVGDSQYDSNRVHHLAAPQHQIVAPQRKPSQHLGHRRHAPSRVHSFEMVKRNFGPSLLHYRGQIERCFGNLTNFACGLSPLPNWVRGPHRVRLGVQAKLLLNAIRQKTNQNSTNATA
jgi:Transposase DDE domain